MHTDPAIHRKRAEVIRQAQERKQARATERKGLLIVNTGAGKGKTTAAFGMGLRVIGHGRKLAVVQFVKGAMATAERQVMENLPGVEWHTIGDGFTWVTQDREKDIATARRAWEQALRLLQDPSFAMVILDEFNIVLAHGYMPLEEALEGLATRSPGQHAVITGRGAPEGLVAVADMVNRIDSIKHPFAAGITAQEGIEF
ncbi:MAG: cob(I)yrinic acid a,c-diamide adenosyltransferase [Fibrobacteria bacterium]|nr:cob(I)yrinic acid a,c-diamide adenosyltransferase [Fibrobacteria bacterium]